MDANFRLKNNLVSNYSSDPGLGIGMAYLVPLSKYSDYVLSQADEEDVSTLHLLIALHAYSFSPSTDQHLRGVPSPCEGDNA